MLGLDPPARSLTLPPASLAPSCLRERQWADPDVADDVEAVYSALMNNFRELSTFERWAAEVNGKNLKFGTPSRFCRVLSRPPRCRRHHHSRHYHHDYDHHRTHAHTHTPRLAGLVHSEKFWRENAKELEANDFALLKALIELLKSDENEVVSVACYDLGEWVRFFPNGKSIVKNLGAKDLVMAKIEDPDADVQRHALQCMSKIMVQVG